MVCCFTSSVELVPSFDNTAQSAAEALLTIFGATHVMAAFRHLLNISADFTIPYRPQSNGIVERKNLNVLTHLRALLTTNSDVINNWHSLLSIAQRICNANDVCIGCAPAQIIFGNMIHLHRGLNSDFTPPLPHTKGATAYIDSLLSGQRDLILSCPHQRQSGRSLAFYSFSRLSP